MTVTEPTSSSECTAQGDYCYEYTVDGESVCNCPSDPEIYCNEQGGWWYESAYESYTTCELPSELEQACIDRSGYWETLYYDVNGMLSRLPRKDGYCVEAVDAELHCEESGGFWQFGYWASDGTWAPTSGQCAYANEDAYENCAWCESFA